jgi:streptogrisin C
MSSSVPPPLQMKKQVLVTFAACFLLLTVAAQAAAAAVSVSASSLLAAINSTRATRGLSPVRADVGLGRAARSHSLEMLKDNSFSHVAFRARMRASHARGPTFGENLAWGTAATPTWIIGHWLASPRHRAVLLRPGWRRIGIGIAAGTFAGRGGAAVVTADFAGR